MLGFRRLGYDLQAIKTQASFLRHRATVRVATSGGLSLEAFVSRQVAWQIRILETG